MSSLSSSTPKLTEEADETEPTLEDGATGGPTRPVLEVTNEADDVVGILFERVFAAAVGGNGGGGGGIFPCGVTDLVNGNGGGDPVTKLLFVGDAIAGGGGGGGVTVCGNVRDGEGVGLGGEPKSGLEFDEGELPRNIGDSGFCAFGEVGEKVGGVKLGGEPRVTVADVRAAAIPLLLEFAVAVAVLGEAGTALLCSVKLLVSGKPPVLATNTLDRLRSFSQKSFACRILWNDRFDFASDTIRSASVRPSPLVACTRFWFARMSEARERGFDNAASVARLFADPALGKSVPIGAAEAAETSLRARATTLLIRLNKFG